MHVDKINLQSFPRQYFCASETKYCAIGKAISAKVLVPGADYVGRCGLVLLVRDRLKCHSCAVPLAASDA
jgi:hypothetical protein